MQYWSLVIVVKHVQTIINFKLNITLITQACYIDKRDMYIKIIAAYLHIHWSAIKEYPGKYFLRWILKSIT